MDALCARSSEHGHARSRSRRTSIRKSSRDHSKGAARFRSVKGHRSFQNTKIACYATKGREVIRFLKPLTVNLLGPCQEIFPPRKAAEMLPAPCEEANSVESCTVTALDAITAFAVPNPNCPSRSSRFSSGLVVQQVTLPNGSPSLLRTGQDFFQPTLL